MNTLRILSLGAGVQSSCLALMASRSVIDFDYAIFADTQAEPESVYDYLEYLIGKMTFPLIKVTRGDLLAESMRYRISKNGIPYLHTNIPAFTLHDSTGKRGMLNRQCTVYSKVTPVKQAIQKLRERGQQVEMSLGISTDEATRMKDSRVKYIVNRYPLIELGMSRNDCIEWLRSNEYREPPKSACFMCPFHSDSEWRRLRDHEPEAFERAVAFEKKYQIAFKKISRIESTPYLHKSRVPLDEVYFFDDQFDLFENDCTGHCGV